MSRIEIIELLVQAQQDLENLPVGGIGADGATQSDLDYAAYLGDSYNDNAEYHQGQLAWLRIQKAIDTLKLKATR